MRKRVELVTPARWAELKSGHPAAVASEGRLKTVPLLVTDQGIATRRRARGVRWSARPRPSRRWPATPTMPVIRRSSQLRQRIRHTFRTIAVRVGLPNSCVGRGRAGRVPLAPDVTDGCPQNHHPARIRTALPARKGPWPPVPVRPQQLFLSATARLSRCHCPSFVSREETLLANAPASVAFSAPHKRAINPPTVPMLTAVLLRRRQAFHRRRRCLWLL